MAQSILVAEDERNLVEALSFLMRRAGYDVNVTHDGLTTEGQLKNMSLNGLFVETPQRIPLNDSVRLTIYDRDRPLHRCNLDARVVRKTETGLGLRLEKMLLEP